MSEEAASHSERFIHAALQLAEEVMAVEVVEFLQVPEDAPPLAPEVLRDVGPLQLREVVFSNVTQSLHILPLRGQQLLHYPPQFPVPPAGNEKCKISDVGGITLGFMLLEILYKIIFKWRTTVLFMCMNFRFQLWVGGMLYLQCIAVVLCWTE